MVFAAPSYYGVILSHVYDVCILYRIRYDVVIITAPNEGQQHRFFTFYFILGFVLRMAQLLKGHGSETLFSHLFANRPFRRPYFEFDL